MPDSRLSHIQDSQERLELSVLLDRADRVADRMTPEVSGFMSPRIAQLATGILPGVRGIRFRLEGGFRDAERCRILIWPDEPWAEEPDPEKTEVLAIAEIVLFKTRNTISINARVTL